MNTPVIHIMKIKSTPDSRHPSDEELVLLVQFEGYWLKHLLTVISLISYEFISDYYLFPTFFFFNFGTNPFTCVTVFTFLVSRNAHALYTCMSTHRPLVNYLQLTKHPDPRAT